MYSPPKNPTLAAILSFFLNGVGQIYNGEIVKGIVIIVVQIVNALLMSIIIGFITLPIVWIWSIYDAYTVAKRINDEALQQAWNSTKVCPQCAERVNSGARVCHFCGYQFMTAAQQLAAPAPVLPVAYPTQAEPVAARSAVGPEPLSYAATGPVADAPGIPGPQTQAGPVARFCPMCGQQVGAAARFCLSCGYQLAQPAATQSGDGTGTDPDSDMASPDGSATKTVPESEAESQSEGSDIPVLPEEEALPASTQAI